MKRMIACTLPLLSLLALTPALHAATQVSRASLQKQDIVLLQRVEETAADVLTTSERLDSYNRVPNEYSRECHMVQLEALKDQINTMTRDLDRLASTREGLDAADRRAVERVLISAVELAQSANAVILKAGRAETSPALNVEYRKMTADCYRQAEQLVKALSAGIAELR
jgi:hypothetical protein